MGFRNKHGLGPCRCCCWARTPEVPESIEFLVDGRNRQAPFNRSHARLTIRGRAEDIWQSAVDSYPPPGSPQHVPAFLEEMERVLAVTAGWFYAGDHQPPQFPTQPLVLLDDPTPVETLVGADVYDPPANRPLIAYYGVSNVFEYVVDDQCQTHRRTDLFVPWQLSIYRRVHRAPNGSLDT